MQDTTIYKGEYCYQFRLDVDYTKIVKTELVEEHLQEWFSRYCLAKENKKSNNVMHLQGILWRSQPLSDNDKKSIRTWFLQQKILEVPKTGGISLTSARKVDSLSKYCNDKEKKGLITFQVDTKLLGKWSNPEAKKALLKEKVIKAFQEYKIDNVELTKIELIQQVLKVCLEEKARPYPIKTIYWYALQAGRISQSTFTMEYYGICEYQDPPKNYNEMMNNYHNDILGYTHNGKTNQIH